MATKPVEKVEPEAPFVIRGPYRGSRARVVDRVITKIVGADRTKQSFRDECDINTIMKRYEATGILPGMDRVAGARYMDCRNADYLEAMQLVASARSAFAEMPARIRDRFGNDPAQLMRFLEDARNLEEARELGLARPEAKEATPLAVRVVESPVAHPSESSGVFPAPGPAANAGPVPEKRKS